MANEKELTELYSGPGAESFRGFEDENGRVRATMRPGEIVTAAPWGAGMAIQDGGISLNGAAAVKVEYANNAATTKLTVGSA